MKTWTEAIFGVEDSRSEVVRFEGSIIATDYANSQIVIQLKKSSGTNRCVLPVTQRVQFRAWINKVDPKIIRYETLDPLKEDSEE